MTSAVMGSPFDYPLSSRLDENNAIFVLWDATSTEFGGCHELYERNYAGNHETIRFEPLLVAEKGGLADDMMGFVDECMADYDLDGWTADDLINPDDVNYFSK